jgi:hypothetical protein
MVYTGIVVTDVRVERTLFHNASVKIMFEGDTDDIMQVPILGTTQCGNDVLGYFLFLSRGIARMEIKFEGRTRTATLQEGQVFVALDTCNGGIGFGSFVNPNGPEPAYPLAFTLGTAEYAAIINGSPLTGALSVTGSAWSCIGYPPLGWKKLDRTASGNCTPPDTYPLKSDIGKIYIYQPYYEYQGPGATEISTNHAGSTNRGVFLARPQATSSRAASGARESEIESGVVYTLQTVADGSIGNHVFYQALVTLQMISNSRSVTTQPSPVDSTKSLYENHVGYATVTVDDGGTVINARFEPGEVYVRYDTGAGVAGFGSQISPTYPIALNCSDSAYPSESNYTVDCLQGEAWNYLNNSQFPDSFHGGTLGQLSYPVSPSAGTVGLPQSLSQNTLLTGTAHTCAGVYTIDPLVASIFDPYFPGDLGVCGGPAPRGLHTSRGDLFFQDLEGGTLSLGFLAPQGEAGSSGGWDLANSGFLHVEVLRGDH